jgi:hypothetical protein
MQTQRYLRVKNDTGEKLTVHVQYRTITDRDQWAWVPADPRQSADQVATFDVEPGADVPLSHDSAPIKGSRVRMWAASQSGKEWADARQKDLWLVPESDGKGSHYYLAADTEAFTYTFSE